MGSQKGSRPIIVGDVEYRWRARGDDGYITFVISHANRIGPRLRGNFRYHETWIPEGQGVHRSAGDQIVITPRLIRRVIEYAITTRGYNPLARGEEINLYCLDDVIQWDDAVRAGDTAHPPAGHDPKTGATS